MPVTEDKVISEDAEILEETSGARVISEEILIDQTLDLD